MQVSFTAAMPKVGRFSVGSQRPKKKKVEDAAAAEEPSDCMDGDEEPSAAPPVPPDGMVDTTDLWARFDLMQVSMKATLDESNEAKRLELNVERARLEHEVVNRR